MITKKLTFDDDVLETIAAMEWETTNAGTVGRIVEQLDRPMYTRTNKALEALGGKWNRKMKGHLFEKDPRPTLPGFLEDGYLTVVKDGFFETPGDVVDRLLDLYPHGRIQTPILEPSAGKGAIIRHMLQYEGGLSPNDFYAIEQNPDRRAILKDLGVHVLGNDFMTYFSAQKFPTIVMNPPFEQGQDVDHVLHAFHDCLADGGVLLAIMSAGVSFRSDRKYVDFRELVDHHGAIYSLPENAFKESGTGVNTVMVVLQK